MSVAKDRLPKAGGSYVRGQDGALERVEGTAPAPLRQRRAAAGPAEERRDFDEAMTTSPPPPAPGRRGKSGKSTE